MVFDVPAGSHALCLDDVAGTLASIVWPGSDPSQRWITGLWDQVPSVKCLAGSGSARSEQIRVSSRTDEVQVGAIDLLDQQPIRLDVAVAKVLPISAERMVLAARRQRTSVNQQQDDPRNLAMSLPRL